MSLSNTQRFYRNNNNNKLDLVAIGYTIKWVLRELLNIHYNNK